MNEFDIPDNEDLSAYKQKKKERIASNKALSFFSSAAMIILALSVTSFNEMVKVSFSFKAIVWSSFILSLITKVVTIYLCKYVGADLRYRSEVEGEGAQSAKSSFSAQSKGINVPDFEKWVYKENERRKRQAYKDSILTKIAQADTTMRLLEYRQKARYRKRRDKRIESLKSNIQEWRRLITDEYINEHIGYIRVKYTELRVIDFLTEVEVGAPIQERYGMSEQGEITKDIAKGIPTTILLTVAFTLLGGSYVFNTVNVFVLLLDMIMLLFYFFQGFYITGKRATSTLIHVYCARETILLRYNAEREEAARQEAVQPVVPLAEENKSGRI